MNGPAIGEFLPGIDFRLIPKHGITALGPNDLVYSGLHATFNTPIMRWGLAAEGCSSFTFPMLLGHQKAAALLIAGEKMTAEELFISSQSKGTSQRRELGVEVRRPDAITHAHPVVIGPI